MILTDLDEDDIAYLVDTDDILQGVWLKRVYGSGVFFWGGCQGSSIDNTGLDDVK